MEKVKFLAGKLNVEIFNYHSGVEHHLLSRNNTTPAIIVLLNNKDKKAALVLNSKIFRINASDMDYDAKDPNYVSDHLTKLTAELLHLARGRRHFTNMVSRDKNIHKNQ